MRKKCTEENIHKVCKLISEGYYSQKISRITGVDPCIISKIKCGKEYLNISCKYDFRNMHVGSGISKKKINKVRELISEGYHPDEISKIVRVTKPQIRNIKTSIAYQENLSRFKQIQILNHIILELDKKKKDVSAISSIRTGKRYKNISSDYDF